MINNMSKLSLIILPAFFLQGCALESVESSIADCEYQAAVSLAPSSISGKDRAFLKLDYVNSCLKKKGYAVK